MPPSPRATFRAALPPGAAPAGAMACLLPSTLSLIASPATLISILCSYTTSAMRPHSWSDFHLLYFPLPCQEAPQMFFCPPHSLLCCYGDFPTALLPIPGMPSGVPLPMCGRAQALLTYFCFHIKGVVFVGVFS